METTEELIDLLQYIKKELLPLSFSLHNSKRPGDQSLGYTLSDIIYKCTLAIDKNLKEFK